MLQILYSSTEQIEGKEEKVEERIYMKSEEWRRKREGKGEGSNLRPGDDGTIEANDLNHLNVYVVNII